MNSENILCYVNNWLVDIASGSLIHRKTGEQKRLGEYQLKLLEILIDNADRVLTREELTEHVWQQRIVGNNSLPNAIHALRLALDDNGKHQRIIKTIPKRGYLLEKAFCSFEPITPRIETVQQNNEQSGVISQLEHLIPTESKQSKKGKTNLIALFCCFCLALSAYFYLTSIQITDKDHFDVQQLNDTTFKHIRLFQVIKNFDDNEKSADPDKVEQRLQPALQKLDSRLAETNSNLNIYYQTSDTILNYTFAIESPCQKKELSMTIYHWRINTERLNDLILHETERTLNEAILCLN